MLMVRGSEGKASVQTTTTEDAYGVGGKKS